MTSLAMTTERRIRYPAQVAVVSRPAPLAGAQTTGPTKCPAIGGRAGLVKTFSLRRSFRGNQITAVRYHRPGLERVPRLVPAEIQDYTSREGP